MPDTSLAPTEDEFTVARRRGIPVLAFREAGVTMEPEQQRFATRVEAYAAGFFRDSFTDTSDLLIKVAKAVRELEQRPATLQTRPLDGPLPADWLSACRQPAGYTAVGKLELHVIPVSPIRISATGLESAAESLVREGRASGHFAQAEGRAGGCRRRLRLGGRRAAWAASRAERRADLVAPAATGQHGRHPGPLLARGGHRGDAAPGRGPRQDRAVEVALAAALDPLDMMVVEGDASELGRRNRVSVPGMPTNKPVRVDAEEAVPARSLVHGAVDLARELALRLVHAFRKVEFCSCGG
jgi:hypothetical protein